MTERIEKILRDLIKYPEEVYSLCEELESLFRKGKYKIEYILNGSKFYMSCHPKMVWRIQDIILSLNEDDSMSTDYLKNSLFTETSIFKVYAI